MAKAQKHRGPTPRARVSEPTRTRQRRIGWLAWLAVGLLAAGGAFWVAKEQATGGGEAIAPPAKGLPATPDYHSLLVDAANPNRVFLGTHVGVYESTDGGVTWRFAGLKGKDAMHFARVDEGTIWTAGHDVLEKSEDAGHTWTEVRPEGLPGLDVHGFAVSPKDGTVYAAIAGEGLYRSTDGGKNFGLVSAEVGPGVTALAVSNDGALFAADGERGVLVNAGGDGRRWTQTLNMATIGLASNALESPRDRMLAAGETVQLRTDEAGWETVLRVEDGAGPVAFAPSDPDIAYAVGFDRTLYRSEDGGRSWSPVG
ncbi:MAG: YCF48-related protein [Actinomycetota bacterium]|nr:YCF48-related protein [Actinomycetota bacterium]